MGAEKVTKLLRAKNATPKSVVHLANDLLLGEIPVYLPNAVQFVFDLVCDRMNEFVGKEFKNWKQSAQLWALWEKSWLKVGKSDLAKEARAKSFAGVRLLQVVLEVLEKVYQEAQKTNEHTEKVSKKRKLQQVETIKKVERTGSVDLPSLSSTNLQLLSNMFSCLHIFMTTGYILVDEFSAVGLLKAYMDVLLLLYESDAETDSWTLLISNFYNIPRQSTTYKPSAKGIAKYYNEVLPITLKLLSKNKKFLLDQSYSFCYLVFCQILFKGGASSIVSHLKTHDEFLGSLSDESIEYLFEQSLLHFAPSDVSQCEILYSSFTKNRPERLSTSLLRSLSKLNRVISPGFCKALYDQEFQKQNPNFSLIAQLMSIDSELAINQWKDVIDSADKSDAYLNVATSLALGFVRVREYSLFLSEVYPYALQISNIWDNEKTTKTLSEPVKDLSSSEIQTLVKKFVSSSLMKPLLLVVRGLLLCSQSKQDAVKELFLKTPLDLVCSQVAFYISCLYGEEASERKLSTPNPENISTYFDLCVVLRNIELSGNLEKLPHKDMNKFISKGSNDEFSMFLRRWLVLVDKLPETHSNVMDRLFSSPQETISEFFRNQAVVVFELARFLKSMLEYVERKSVPFFKEILLLFPPIVIRKFFAGYVKKLSTDVKRNPSFESLRALAYILRQPSLSFDIETQVDLLVSVVRSASAEGQPIALEIATNVCNAHMRNINDARSQNYILEFIAQLLRNLSKAQNCDLALTRCILFQIGALSFENFEKLIEKYVKVVCRKLSSDNFEEQLDMLLGIPLITRKAKSSVRQVLKTYGSSTISPGSTTKLFELIVTTCEAANYAFVFSLFVALCQQMPEMHHEVLIQNLLRYVTALPNKNYEDAFAQVIFSFGQELSISFVAPLLDVLSVLLSLIRRESGEVTQALVTSALLKIAKHTKSCESVQSLLRVLNCLSLSLALNPWGYGQYSVELAMEICNNAVISSSGAQKEPIFISAISAFSSVILFHRLRLSSRYHIVVSIMTRFMENLSGKGQLGSSVSAAAAFLRTLTSLCEPQVYGATKDSKQLTSQAALYKTAFRPHAHVLLINFISIHLLDPFTGEIYDRVIAAIHTILALMMRDDLRLARQCLDSQGRTYLQTLYAKYNKNFSWSVNNK